MADEKPKIIVDDDWKTRVQAEKESLLSGASAPSASAAGSTGAAPESKPAAAQPSAEFEEQLPPASFEALVSLLVTQALAALGQIPVADNQEPVVMLDHAKHYIDLLGILEAKTKGNLSHVESEMLTRILHELRMVFVAVQNHTSQRA